jgi:hypothetical protein
MPKAKQINAIEQMAKDVVGSSLSNIELVELGASLASARFDVVTASEQYDALAKSARESGLKLVDTRKTKGVAPEHVEQTKLFKGGFIDTLVAKGLKAKTAQNYYQELVPCINEGKVFSTNTSKQNSAKGKGGKNQKGKGSTDAEKMVSAWLNVWKLSDVAPDSLAFIESKLDNGMSLIDAITDYLKSEGQPIATEESEEIAE